MFLVRNSTYDILGYGTLVTNKVQNCQINLLGQESWWGRLTRDPAHFPGYVAAENSKHGQNFYFDVRGMTVESRRAVCVVSPKRQNSRS